MKKFFSIVLSASLMILLVGNIAMAKGKSDGEITLVGKMGMDLMGKIGNKDNSREIENSFSVAGEGLYNINSKLAIGAGVEYQPEREMADFVLGHLKYSAIPVYGLVKYTLPVEREFELFFTGKIGCNFSTVKATSSIFDLFGIDSPKENNNGVCFGGGVGFVYDKMFLVELNYSLYNIDEDFCYSKLTLAGGINFSL